MPVALDAMKPHGAIAGPTGGVARLLAMTRAGIVPLRRLATGVIATSTNGARPRLGVAISVMMARRRHGIAVGEEPWHDGYFCRGFSIGQLPGHGL